MLPEDLPFEIFRSPRRRTWSLKIEPEKGLCLSVPEKYSEDAVEKILRRHLPWIERRWRKMKTLPNIKLTQQWMSGEKYFYRGRYWTFRFERATYPHVREDEGDMLIVATSDFSAAAIKRIVEGWIEQQTKKHIEDRLPLWAAQFKITQIPPYRIKRLRRSWGICRSSGKLSFNAQLARFHPDFVDYVIVHELAHLFEMNHSMRFKAIVTGVLPHWRAIVKTHEPKIFS